jgi:hypothetical protein
MTTRTTLLAALALVVGANGCRAIGDLDHFTFDSTGAGGGTSTAAGTSAAAGTSSSSAGGGTGASSSSSAGGGEVCGNGVDDDGNGLVDCADPACSNAGFTCAAPPIGWQGPATLVDDPGSNAACPAGFPEAILRGGSAVAGAVAACSACTCGAPAPACQMSPLVIYDNPACKGSSMSIASPPGQCTPVLGDVQGVMQLPPIGSSTCAPSPVTAVLPPPKWTTPRLACGAAAGGGCSGGSSCAPPGGPWCVFHDGDQACPAAFSQKHLLGDATDLRGCGACSCAPAPCAATSALYGDSACQSKLADLLNNGACAAQAGVASVLVTLGPPAGASCAPSGGAPIGAITLDHLTTFCCAQ